MPRKQKGARLYLRRRKGREGVWVILDGDKELSTGCAEGQREEAEATLARYITVKSRPDERQVTLGQVLLLYLESHAPTVADPARIAYACRPLIDFWGLMGLDEVTPSACREYGRQRGVGAGTLRRELAVLQAALNYAVKENWYRAAPRVTLPARPAPRERWLTRSEAARFLWACRHPKRRHIARAVLIMIYTGTRGGAVKALHWEPNREGGWIDTASGLLHRQPMGKAQSKKRQPPIRIPRQLLAHARRWKRDGQPWVIHHAGKPVLTKFRHGWAEARDRAGLGEEVVPHVLRHTAVTWAMQRGAPIWETAGYFGLTLETLQAVYGHHHPAHFEGAVAAMERKR